MRAFHYLNRRWQLATGTDEAILDNDTKSFLASLIFHLSILLVIALLYFQPTVKNQPTMLVLDDDQVEPEIVEFEMPVDIIVSEEQLPEVGVTSMGIVDEATSAMGEVLRVAEPSEFIESTVELSGVNVAFTELFANSNSDELFEDLAGIKGSVINANGDRGSVDRITTEILARLELSDVLVVWLMDASESLRPRREQIIRHFDRVYDELDELAADRGDSLLTSVASFGRAMKVMTPEPTADRSEIQAAVSDIQADESGVENVFTAIKGIAATYADMTKTDRKVMMVVVTDERGNDLPALDEALAMVQQNEMAVYVIGPVAPFARNEVKVKWIDPETREHYNLPVDLGPETLYVEHAWLPVWKDGPGADPMSSGFGPYGLTRLTHANGGLYLLTDDNTISGPTFDIQDLLRYRPEYVSSKDYETLARKSPLRLAVLRTAQATNEMLKEPLPRTFLAAGIQFEIMGAKKKISNTLDMVNRGLRELAAAEKTRGKETSPRWLAHHDLLTGRLLANQVRLYSSAQRMGEMYNNPQAPKDGTKNAWELAALENTESVEAMLPPDVKKSADAAREHLQRVVDEHPDTPWAVIAQAELEFPLLFQWQEAFKEPPEGVPLPWDLKPWETLTPAEKEAKLAFDKKKAERAKRKKERKKKEVGVAKKPPPKL